MSLSQKIKENEKSVLETFQKEIPSIYYSDKTEKEFQEYKKNAEYKYRQLFFLNILSTSETVGSSWH